MIRDTLYRIQVDQALGNVDSDFVCQLVSRNAKLATETATCSVDGQNWAKYCKWTANECFSASTGVAAYMLVIALNNKLRPSLVLMGKHLPAKPHVHGFGFEFAYQTSWVRQSDVPLIEVYYKRIRNHSLSFP